MTLNTRRGVAAHARAGFQVIALGFVVAGCSSPTPAGTPPPATAPSAAAAPAGSSPVERDSAATAAADTTAAVVPSAAAPLPPPPPPTPPRRYTLSTGHPISAYTSSTLSTKTNKAGETFAATLAEPIVDGDWVIAKKGARVTGVIVLADPGARVKGVASIAVTLDSLTLADGRLVELSASNYSRQAKATKGKDAKKIGIGAGVGAAIGAIAGGGKGAAIGAGIGGGAGTGAVLATRGDPAVIPAETRLRVTLKAPVTITKGRS